MRGRSYSPSPPPRGSYGRRGRSPSPRGRYRGRSRDLPTSLLVRNLRHGCRPEDLRRPFGHFGPLKDIYLPRDYYTGHQSSNKSSLEDDVNGSEDGKEVGYEYILKTSSLEEFQAILKLTLASQPRGFGFVQYIDPADAAEAKYQMDGQILLGRELTVVFAEENRKKPTDMRARERGSGGGRYDRRRSPRYSRSRSHSPQYSRSPPPRRGRSRSRSQGYDSPPPKRKHYSRSVSPQERRHSEERRRGQLQYSQSPSPNGSRSPSRSRSRSPARGQSCSVTPNSDRSPRQ